MFRNTFSIKLKVLLALTANLFIYYNIAAQPNLVSNPSFEDYVDCPFGAGQIQQIIGWHSFRESPDYFNSCASMASYFSVPSNGFGYQQAASGNAYVGIICYNNSILSREIIANSLSTPLSIGQKYFISFKTSKANDTITAGYSINNLGAKFSTIQQTNASIDNAPMVYTSSVISDTVNWTTISGSFIADSAYKYLMIGNFFDDANTTIVNNGTGSWAYYLIDDVCLSTDSLLCADFTVSVEENSINNQFAFYPNPASDFFSIQRSSNVPYHLTVFNSIGQQLYSEQNITSNDLQLNVGSYNTGLIFIKITSQNNQFIYKLLKL